MSLLTNYRIDIDCLLTWFPVRHGATLREPGIRMDTFSYAADDQPFASGNKAGRFHVQAPGRQEDSLDSSNRVRAISETGVDADQVFYMEIEVGLGRTVRTRRVSFPSNSVTPFLINLRAAQGETPELNDTAVAFQGVVTAGRRRSELIYLVARVLSRITRIPLKRETRARLTTDHAARG